MPVSVINPSNGDDLVVASIIANVTEKIRLTYESHESGATTNGALRHASDQIDEASITETTTPDIASHIGSGGVHSRLDMYAGVLSGIMGTAGTGYAVKYGALGGLTYGSISALNTALTTGAQSTATNNALVRRDGSAGAAFGALTASSLASSGAVSGTSGTFSGVITAGSGSNAITTIAGLLDATKLTNALPAASFPTVGGDVAITAGSPSTSVVSSVGGKTAANIATVVTAILAASSTGVGNHGANAKFDSSGGMTFDGTVTAPTFNGNLVGTATTTTNAAQSTTFANMGANAIPMGAATAPTGTAPVMLTGSATGQVVSWDATLNSGAGGWKSALLTGANLVYASTSRGVLSENAIVANGTSSVTVTASTFVDKAGNSHTWNASTFTLGAGIASAVTAPAGGTQWVTVYRDPADLVNPKFIVSALNAPTAPPVNTGDMYALSGYLLMRSGSLLVDQTDQSGAKGYVVDGRTTYQANILGTATGGIIGVAGGGTGASTAAGARANLAAAGSGTNTDIATMSGAGSGLIFQNVTQLNTGSGQGITVGPNGTLAFNSPGFAPSTAEWTRWTMTDSSRQASYTSAQTGATGVSGYSVHRNDTYLNATNNLASPFTPTLVNYVANLTVGTLSVPNVAGTGSAFTYQSNITVNNCGNALNEHANYTAYTTYANGLQSGALYGRGWLLDLTLLGAVGVQQSGLSGSHVQLGNYYNGSPGGISGTTLQTGTTYSPIDDTTTNNGSAGYTAISVTWNSSSPDVHASQPTYPNDVGFGAIGASGSAGSLNARQGWRVGFQSGGKMGNYGDTINYMGGSRIGTGFFSRDHEQYAFRAWKRFTGSNGVAFMGHATAGNSIVGASTDTIDYISAATVGAGYVKSTWQIGDNFSVDATNQSVNFSVNGGTLGTVYDAATPTNTSNINLASFGVLSTTSVALVIRALRNTNVVSTAASAIVGIGREVANSALTMPFLGANATGWGFGLGEVGINPQHMVDVWGNVHPTNLNTTTHAHMLPSTNGTAVAIVTSGVIPSYYDYYGLNPASSVINITVADGAYDGQMLAVTNISAANSVTFFGTQANFANGLVPSVLSSYQSHLWRWVASTSKWYIIN